MKSHDPHHSRDAWRVDSLLLSYHDPLVESLLSHPVRPAFFGIRMSSYFSFWGTPFWSVSLIQLWTWMTRIAHSMRDDLISFNFRPITHLMPYWDIFPLRLSFVDLHWFAWPSPVMRYTPGWWFDFISPWFSDGAFLETFGQACIFWYRHDSWMELSQTQTPTSSFQESTCQISYTSLQSYSQVIKTDWMT